MINKVNYIYINIVCNIRRAYLIKLSIERSNFLKTTKRIQINTKVDRKRIIITAIKVFITAITYFSILPIPEDSHMFLMVVLVFVLSRFLTLLESLLCNDCNLTVTGIIDLLLSLILSVLTLLLGMNNITIKFCYKTIMYVACGTFLVLDIIILLSSIFGFEKKTALNIKEE